MRISLKERFEHWWEENYPYTVEGKSAAWAAWLRAWDHGYREHYYEEMRYEKFTGKRLDV
jgi:hypothetical protein